MTTRTFRPYDPDEQWLLPPSPWTGWRKATWCISFWIRSGSWTFRRSRPRMNRKNDPWPAALPPADDGDVAAVRVLPGNFSSRRIEQACRERVTFRVIVGSDIPNFRTISDFRKLHLKALEGLFVQVLRLCQAAGLVKLGTVALDGSKVKANASRHKAMSYGRMGTRRPGCRPKSRRCSSRRRRPMSAMTPRMGRLGVAMNAGRVGAPGAAAADDSRRQGCVGGGGAGGGGAHADRPHGRRDGPAAPGPTTPAAPARSLIPKPSAISPIRRAESCQRPMPRAACSKATTAKPRWMRRRRSLLRRTSPMRPMTSSRRSHC